MKSSKCPQCGLINFATSMVCKKCQATLTEAMPSGGGIISSSFGNAVYSNPAPVLINPASGYYQASGKFSLLGLVGSLSIGAFFSCALAILYAYLDGYIPIIYLNFFLTFGFGAGIGLISGWLMRAMKIRNTLVGGIVAFLTALIALYCSWAVWLSLMLGWSHVDVPVTSILTNPVALWETVSKINEIGAWSIKGTQVNGIALWLIWLMEALAILLIAPLMAVGFLTADPFCETCESWCDLLPDSLLLADTPTEKIKHHVEAKDFAFLQAVGKKRDEANEWYRLDIHNCASCGNTSTISLKQENLQVNSQGKVEKKTTPVLAFLFVSRTDVQKLQQLSHEL